MKTVRGSLRFRKDVKYARSPLLSFFAHIQVKGPGRLPWGTISEIGDTSLGLSTNVMLLRP